MLSAIFNHSAVEYRGPRGEIYIPDSFNCPQFECDTVPERDVDFACFSSLQNFQLLPPFYQPDSQTWHNWIKISRILTFDTISILPSISKEDVNPLIISLKNT